MGPQQSRLVPMTTFRQSMRAAHALDQTAYITKDMIDRVIAALREVEGSTRLQRTKDKALAAADLLATAFLPSLLGRGDLKRDGSAVLVTSNNIVLHAKESSDNSAVELLPNTRDRILDCVLRAVEGPIEDDNDTDVGLSSPQTAATLAGAPLSVPREPDGMPGPAGNMAWGPHDAATVAASGHNVGSAIVSASDGGRSSTTLDTGLPPAASPLGPDEQCRPENGVHGHLPPSPPPPAAVASRAPPSVSQDETPQHNRTRRPDLSALLSRALFEAAEEDAEEQLEEAPRADPGLRGGAEPMGVQPTGETQDSARQTPTQTPAVPRFLGSPLRPLPLFFGMSSPPSGASGATATGSLALPTASAVGAVNLVDAAPPPPASAADAARAAISSVPAVTLASAIAPTPPPGSTGSTHRADIVPQAEGNVGPMYQGQETEPRDRELGCAALFVQLAKIDVFLVERHASQQSEGAGGDADGTSTFTCTCLTFETARRTTMSAARTCPHILRARMSILNEKEASLWPATDGDAIITSLAKPDKPVTQRQEDNYSRSVEDAYSDLSIIEAQDPKNMEAAERHLVAGVFRHLRDVAGRFRWRPAEEDAPVGPQARAHEHQDRAGQMFGPRKRRVSAAKRGASQSGGGPLEGEDGQEVFEFVTSELLPKRSRARGTALTEDQRALRGAVDAGNILAFADPSTIAELTL